MNDCYWINDALLKEVKAAISVACKPSRIPLPELPRFLW